VQQLAERSLDEMLKDDTRKKTEIEYKDIGDPWLGAFGQPTDRVLLCIALRCSLGVKDKTSLQQIHTAIFLFVVLLQHTSPQGQLQRQ